MGSEHKPFASLGPTLLARKGSAKPAMRPQMATLGSFERAIMQPVQDLNDDLGWNDMGEGHVDGSYDPVHPLDGYSADVLALNTGEPIGRAPAANTSNPDLLMPAVRQQQEEIARKVAAAPATTNARKKLPVARRSALDEGRRAAFTLRVDAERHLKLRLACTMQNISAQQIVTEALDRLLSEIPDLDTVAAQLQPK